MSSGNYAVYANGFRVNQQTWDDALQFDGKGDEVLVKSVVSLVSNGQPRPVPSPQTYTIGDTNGKVGRIRGGSLSSKGGLRSGDTFPTAEPWRRINGVSAVSLPMRLWTGTLVQGQDVLTIVPSIFEDDEGGTDLYNAFVPWALDAVNTLAPHIQGLVPGSAPYVTATQAGLQVLASATSLVGKKATRPIGMQNGRFDAPMLILDRDAAERIATTDLGKGPGVFEITYNDSSEIGAGSYTLYLSVERA
jgi:hypothetical protein